MSPRRRAMLLMVSFVVLWALIEAMAAQVLSRYSPYQVVWTRYAVHLSLMLLVWGWRQPETLWQTRRPVYQLARSLLMLGMPASWVIGTQMGVQDTALMAIFWLSPLFIVVLAHLFLRERASTLIWAATGIGCLGALLIHEPVAPSPPGLLLFPFGMALCFSLYVVMTRSLRSETTRANLFYTALGVFLALTPFMPAVWQAPRFQDLLVMVSIGVLGYATLYLLDRMAAAAPLSVSAPFAYLQVAFTAALLAGMGLHDVPIRRTALGLLLIGGAALFVWMREPKLQVYEAAAARPIP